MARMCKAGERPKQECGRCAGLVQRCPKLEAALIALRRGLECLKPSGPTARHATAQIITRPIPTHLRQAGQAPRMNQFSFDFTTPPETVASPEGEKPVKVTAPLASTPSGPAGAKPLDMPLEAMAQALEQDPNYRVLRRLVPISDFGPQPPALDPTGRAAPAHRVLVLDTETTGLSHQVDRIIELAMLMVSVDSLTGLPFGPVELFEGFEDPGMPIPAIAREVTGITDDMVRGARLDDAAVASLVGRADLVIAHNAGFDRPFVEARFPDFVGKAWGCSFKDIDWKAAGAESLKLGALAADAGWFYDAHRAQVDCHALLQVLARPVGDAGMTGLGQLITAASQPSYKLSATGSPFESKDVLKGRGYRWDAETKVWSCSVGDEAALEAELAWLAQAVYGGRHATVDVERLDGHSRYAARRGVLDKRRL
jgi:DNA polymerase III subunit epsilon